MRPFYLKFWGKLAPVEATTRIVSCQWMPYNFVVFTRRNFVADFLRVKCDFTRKTAVLRLWAAFGGLGTTYDERLRLIGKRIVDFLLVLIELFTRCYGWGAMRGRRTNHSSSQKTRLNDLSYSIKIWQIFIPFCHNARVWQTDGRSDRQTDSFLIGGPRWHSKQRGKNHFWKLCKSTWSDN